MKLVVVVVVIEAIKTGRVICHGRPKVRIALLANRSSTGKSKGEINYNSHNIQEN